MNAHPPSASLIGPRLSVMMFLQFFIWGSWYVSAGTFMNAAGMAGGIAWAYKVGPLAAIVSPLFLGLVADRLFPTQRVLGVMHLLGGVAMLAAPLAVGGLEESFWPFIALLAAHMLCYMPTLGLTNTLCLHHMTDARRQFPMVRVFGTIGWIAAGTLLSVVFKGETLAVQFRMAGAASLLLGLYAFTLPHTPPPAAGRRARLGEVLGLEALRLLRDRSFAVFLVCSLLICIPLAAYYAFANVYVAASNIANPTFKMSLGQWSEIGFMLLMPLFFVRLGAKWMLAVGMAAWVARYALFSAADRGDVAWMILLGILLHGICYDFFFVTGQVYTDQRAPVHVRGQAQGLLVLVTQGLGLFIGADLMGRIVSRYTPAEAKELQGRVAELNREMVALAHSEDATARAAEITRLGDQAQELAHRASAMIDWQTVWLIPAAAAGVVLMVFLLLFRDRPAPPAASP